jgi:hypothetical protein
MKVSGPLTGLAIGCSMTWLATAALAGQPNPPAADPAVPTAIEEALIEYACGALHPAGAVESDAYLDCRKNQLLYLRTEFGRDLRRLSNTERKTLDTACGDLRAARGQDAYLSCLQAELTRLPGHGKKAASQAVSGAAPATAPGATPPVSPARETSLPISPMWAGVVVAALIAAAAGAFAMKRRGTASAGACRACGAAVVDRGDLCQACRRDAAETLRRGKTEQVDQARAEVEAARRLAARQSEQQQRERDEQTRRHELQAAQAAQARQDEEDAQRRRDEEARRQRQTDASASADEFDPHAVLGVPRDAGRAAIEAAYEEARAKYDLELVADLGVELQDHYRRKGQAAQRAYEMLVKP